jgi:hypothetical protein
MRLGNGKIAVGKRIDCGRVGMYTNMSHSARPAFDVFPSSNFSTRRMMIYKST